MKWLIKLINVFKKCPHPKEYRQRAWMVPPPPKGIDVYWCSLCKTSYTVKCKLIKEEKK
jgi:hypothetical protein